MRNCLAICAKQFCGHQCKLEISPKSVAIPAGPRAAVFLRVPTSLSVGFVRRLFPPPRLTLRPVGAGRGGRGRRVAVLFVCVCVVVVSSSRSSRSNNSNGGGEGVNTFAALIGFDRSGLGEAAVEGALLHRSNPPLALDGMIETHTHIYCMGSIGRGLAQRW